MDMFPQSTSTSSELCGETSVRNKPGIQISWDVVKCLEFLAELFGYSASRKQHIGMEGCSGDAEKTSALL